MKRVTHGPHIVYVERITDREKEYGYLVACYGPFSDLAAATRWIPILKQQHPTFADDSAYWIGTRPLRPATR